VAQSSWSNITGPVSSNSGTGQLLSALLPQGAGAFADTLTALTNNLGNLVPASQLQAEALLANTQAITQNTTAHGSSAAGALDTAGQVASTLTGGLLGSLSPILSGVLSLFGGGGSSTPTPLTTYIPPPSLQFQAANGPGATVQGADYGQSGAPRAIGGTPHSTTQITVQVQAMDSQSFLDHSQDIATAVREAVLNMHSLNDVISDL
jgi:hypothetical protein